jgi:adenosylmethionine-8-amino-7-oxononanoate aminotransferase
MRAEAFERGLLIYPSGGTIDGRSGDHVLLAPPYNVTDEELLMIVDLLEETIGAVLAS